MKNTATFFVSATVIFLSALVISAPSFAAGGSVHWDYTAQGDDWPALLDGAGHLAYPQCSGVSQSPIDIVTATAVAEDYPMNMSWKGKTADAVNNGHTVQFNPDGRSVEIVDKESGILEKFYLVQFHLHNGSEHTVDGKRFDMEAHFVHANSAYLEGVAGGRLAVIGVFLEVDDSESDSRWNKVLKNLPQFDSVTGHGEKLNKKIASSYYKLLPATTEVWTYNGSLTTPGCNEIVNWIVMQESVKIASAAHESFAESQHNHLTYRNVQGVNGRVLTSGNVIGSKK